MDIELQALRVHSEARDAADALRRIFVDAGIESSCYALRMRIKGSEKIIEKVRRKRKEKPDYGVYTVTDVIGVRLIALYRAELPELFRKTLSLILHHEDLRPNPFKKASLEEAVLYTAEAAGAPFNVLLRSSIKDAGVHCLEKFSEEGYSSLHLVCRLDREVPNTEYFIPVEIQIRSVFEDAWGEIDHKFGYSARSGKESTYTTAQGSISEHLRVLKKFSDACAAYADTIRDMALSARGVGAGTGRVISVEADDEIIDRFVQLKVPEVLIAEYKVGRELRGLAEKSKHPDRPRKYIVASEHFSSLSGKIDTEIPDSKHHLFRFYVHMNAALCLLSSGETALIHRAIQIYADLTVDFPGYPLVTFRLAQACSKYGLYDEAISFFVAAHREVGALEEKMNRNGDFGDRLPRADYNHIMMNLQKMLGYAYWAKASYSIAEGDRDERYKLLESAYSITKQALLSQPDNLDLINNLLCYGIEIISINPQRSIVSDLAKYATRLEAEETDDVDIIDSLLQWHILNGSREKAEREASRILDIISRQGRKEDPTLAPVLTRALRVTRTL